MARKGGEVAGIARRTLEERADCPVVTSKNTMDFHQLLTEIIADTAALPSDSEKNK